MPKNDDFFGTQTAEQCPRCKQGLLLVNKLGNKWCSKTECSYHIDKDGVLKKPTSDPDVNAGMERSNNGYKGKGFRRDRQW